MHVSGRIDKIFKYSARVHSTAGEMKCNSFLNGGDNREHNDVGSADKPGIYTIHIK